MSPLATWSYRCVGGRLGSAAEAGSASAWRQVPFPEQFELLLGTVLVSQREAVGG